VEKYTLLCVANNKTITGAPAVTGLPEGWSLRVRPHSLCVHKDRGLAVIVR